GRDAGSSVREVAALTGRPATFHHNWFVVSATGRTTTTNSSTSKAFAWRQARMARPFPVGRGAIGVSSRTRREAGAASTAGTVTYGRVGRTIHFVYGLRPQREPFPLVHFLAVESARTVLRPERVLFHVQEVPHGRYWDRVRPHVELARIEPMPGVGERCGGASVARYLYAHQAGAVRLDALLLHVRL